MNFILVQKVIEQCQNRQLSCSCNKFAPLILITRGHDSSTLEESSTVEYNANALMHLMLKNSLVKCRPIVSILSYFVSFQTIKF